MRAFFAIYIFLIVATVIIFGFRGSKSEKPPLWVFPDMDNQPKFKPQASNDFFENRMNDRPKPVGTVIRGQGWEFQEVFDAGYGTDRYDNPELYTGKTDAGDWARGFPLEVTQELMTTGREKYEIFCAVCHGEAGDGKGVTSQYGVLAANLHLDLYLDMAEGEIFNTITHGKNTMYGYKEKLTPEERWAVILYVRALQRSQNASFEDIPPEKRKELGL